jgi:hypothetical protein
MGTGTGTGLQGASIVMSDIPKNINEPGPHLDEYLRRVYKKPSDDACRIHSRMVRPYGPDVGEEMVRRVQKLMLEQRKHFADRVEILGCASLPGCGTVIAPESHEMGYGARIEVHDSRCPKSVAAMIREQL